MREWHISFDEVIEAIRNRNLNLPGGTLEIEWDGEGKVFLSGPAETVYTGEWISD